jgi:hypothetical protein
MKELEEISKLQDEDYKRLVGVSKADFQFLLMRLQHSKRMIRNGIR